MALALLGLFLAAPAQAEEITYNGSNANQTIDGDSGSLAPTGSFSNNRVTLPATALPPIVGAVYGGYSSSSDTVSGNQVLMLGGDVGVGVCGGCGAGNATNNNVTLSGGSVTGVVYGGSSSYNATYNSVTLSGGSVTGEVYGGSSSYNATYNSVTLSGGSVGDDVYGGASTNFDANYNRVTMSSGSAGRHVYGGSGGLGASYNSVTLTGGSVAGGVYGGEAFNDAASHNSVTLSGGSVAGYVYGGYGHAWTSSATHNHVTLGGTARLAATSQVWGGRVGTGSGDVFTGNRLTLQGWQGTVARVANFEHYDFLLPASIAPGGTQLSVTGIADLTGGGGRSSIVSVGFLGGGRLPQAGDSYTLIDAATLTTDPGLNTTAQGRKGLAFYYDFNLAVVGNTLTATVAQSPRLNPQTKSLSEGRIGSLAFINQSADLIAGQGMQDALQASKNGNSQSFGSLSGGNSRYKSGSHVDVKGASLLVGAATGLSTGNGQLTLGGFFEAGKGDYDSHNSFANAASVNGSGDSNYYGLGLLARQDLPSRLYLEGSLRAGKVEHDYHSRDLIDALGNSARYSSNKAYYGAHLGLGYLLGSLDLYGKYLWARQGAQTQNISGDDYHFAAIDSQRLRLGARYTHVLGENRSLYAGAAWEHEFDGKANASVHGYKLDTPSIKGDSGIFELGLRFQPGQNQALSLEAGLQGYVGKREGFSGNVAMKYRF